MEINREKYGMLEKNRDKYPSFLWEGPSLLLLWALQSPAGLERPFPFSWLLFQGIPHPLLLYSGRIPEFNPTCRIQGLVFLLCSTSQLCEPGLLGKTGKGWERERMESQGFIVCAEGILGSLGSGNVLGEGKGKHRWVCASSQPHPLWGEQGLFCTWEFRNSGVSKDRGTRGLWDLCWERQNRVRTVLHLLFGLLEASFAPGWGRFAPAWERQSWEGRESSSSWGWGGRSSPGEEKSQCSSDPGSFRVLLGQQGAPAVQPHPSCHTGQAQGRILPTVMEWDGMGAG